MGVKERRERQKETLRQEILDAARELFVKEGYENVSMRKIAEKIEYSPTTIYLYFKDKTDLLYSLCEESFAKLLAEFEQITKEDEDPLLCLKRSLRAYIEFGLKYPNHYKVMFLIHPEQHMDVERYLDEKSMGQQSYSQLRKIVEVCINQNRLRQADANLISQALWAAAHGVTSLLIVHPQFPWVDRDILIDSVIDTMLEGLKP